MSRRDPFLREVEALLDASGVSYEIEMGAKHRKVRIGRRLAAIIPFGNGRGTGSASENALARIRRAIKESREGAARPPGRASTGETAK